MEQYYSTFEVAAMCHVSPGSVIRWIHEGKCAASLTAGGHHRIEAYDVIKLLESLRMPVPQDLRVPSPSAGSMATLLIVDDEDGFRKMIRWFFQKNFPHIRVEEAAEGFLAGWKAHGIGPDLIILDVNLPGMDGFHVCQMVRSFPELSRTRIIAVTGCGQLNTKDEILKLGANDFLEKPFEMDLFKRKVEEQLKVLEELKRAA